MTSSYKPWGARIAAFVLLGFVAAAFAPAGHAQSADALAENLATLRSDVEQLSDELTRHKTDTRTELQALSRQKADLQVELDREHMRTAKLRAELGKKRDRITEVSSQGEDLAPVYDGARAAMQAYIERSLPFRRAERLAELEQIEDQRRTGALTYPRALTRLWSFIEDELRMTHENAAFQQTIELDGNEQLAQVVRLGMVMLLFSTNDGTVGFATQGDSGWQFTRARTSAERKQVRFVFDSFKKQIRVGMFHLPNALPQVHTP